MKHIDTIMGRTIVSDPVKDRANAQGKAERGEISPIGYWRVLRATWAEMTNADKQQELREVSDDNR